MKMNWKKENETGGGTYPEGTYRVQVDAWEYTEASTGTKQIRWRCVIREPETLVGKKLTEHTALTAKSLWRVANWVAACGINVDNLGEMDTDGPAFTKVLDSCVNRELYVRVGLAVNPKTGRERNEILDYQAVSTESVDVDMDADVPEFLKEG